MQHTVPQKISSAPLQRPNKWSKNDVNGITKELEQKQSFTLPISHLIHFFNSGPLRTGP